MKVLVLGGGGAGAKVAAELKREEDGTIEGEWNLERADHR